MLGDVDTAKLAPVQDALADDRKKHPERRRKPESAFAEHPKMTLSGGPVDQIISRLQTISRTADECVCRDL